MNINDVKKSPVQVVDKNLNQKKDSQSQESKVDELMKKFDRMENILLLEAKEVKSVKERINEIDDYLDRRDKKPTTVTNSSVEEDGMTSRTPRFRSASKSMRKNHREHKDINDTALLIKAKDIQQKLHDMGDDSKTVGQIETLIRNSRTFLQSKENILSFKRKITKQMLHSLTEEEKSQMDNVSKMG